MLGTLGLVLGTIAFLAYYLIKTISRKSEEYWKKNGVNTVLKNKLTLYDLLTGKKSMVDFDNEYYLELGNEKYGGLNEMGTKSLVVKDLEIAKQILIKDFEYFTDRRDIGKSDPLFSSSLLFMQGHEWKDMRSFLSPTFSSGKIRRMFEQFQASGEKLVQYVMAQYPKRVDGYDVLIGDVVRRYTVDVIGSVAFGMDTGALKDPNSIFLKMANKSSKVDAPRMIRTAIMIVFPRLAEFLGLSILDKQILHFFSPILKSAVKGRESSGEKRNDFLQLLLEAKAGELKDDDEVEGSANLGNEKKSKVELTDAGILSQAFLFFFAG
jgi:cytochrome P450